jgi:hypothetical protein
MSLARRQTQSRRELGETRQASRRNEIMAENYADHVRRRELVRRALGAEEARRRTTGRQTGLSQTNPTRRFMHLDTCVQTRNSGRVFGIR